MDDDISEFYVHTATVETFLGTTGGGVDSFADPVSVVGFSDPTRHLVRDKDGEQIVSESQFFTYPTYAATFTPNSRVTIDGHQARVIRLNENTSGTLELPDHIAVSLT